MINSLINGDCLEVMENIQNESIDLIACDLPYHITSNSWDQMIPLDKLWNHYKRIIKSNGVIALTASQPFTSILVTSNLEMFKHEWIWIKNRGSNFANTVREPMKEHESILIFSRGKWTYNKQMQPRAESGLDRAKYNVKFETDSSNYRKFDVRETNQLSELRVPSSWQKFNCEVGLHPTQKPVALFEYIIKTYSNEGELVLDNCCGSGTTCLAARNLNRNYIGIEKDKDIFDIAVNRLKKKKTLFED